MSLMQSLCEGIVEEREGTERARRARKEGKASDSEDSRVEGVIPRGTSRISSGSSEQCELAVPSRDSLPSHPDFLVLSPPPPLSSPPLFPSHLGQQLVDHAVVDARVVAHRATALRAGEEGT